MFLHLCVILFTGGRVSVSAWIMGHMTGGLCPGGLCPWGPLSRGVFVKGGLCPRWVSVWGSLSWGVPVQGVSVQEGLCQGGICLGGSLSRGSLSGGSLSRRVSERDSPYGNEQVVRILLECILIYFCHSDRLYRHSRLMIFFNFACGINCEEPIFDGKALCLVHEILLSSSSAYVMIITFLSKIQSIIFFWI